VTGPAGEPSVRHDSASGSDLPGGEPSQQDARLAEGLRQAHRRLAALDADDAVKARAVQRLLAISDAAKHDTTRAARRLDRFLSDLDEARSQSGGSPSPEA
jgi:hypothetical protein